MKVKALSFAGIFTALICAAVLISCGNQKKETSAASSDPIERYLDEKVMQPSFGGQVFSAHKIFKTDGNKIYLWAYVQEYYKKSGKTELGSGWSVPLVLTTSGSGADMKILSHQAPGDGELYSADIKKIFPPDLHNQLFNFPGEPGLVELQKRSFERFESIQ